MQSQNRIGSTISASHLGRAKQPSVELGRFFETHCRIVLEAIGFGLFGEQKAKCLAPADERIMNRHGVWFLAEYKGWLSSDRPGLRRLDALYEIIAHSQISKTELGMPYIVITSHIPPEHSWGKRLLNHAMQTVDAIIDIANPYDYLKLVLLNRDGSSVRNAKRILRFSPEETLEAFRGGQNGKMANIS